MSFDPVTWLESRRSSKPKSRSSRRGDAHDPDRSGYRQRRHPVGLLTYAIHSTILLGVALIIALRFADEHAWLDLVWKAALLGPLVTASVQVGSGLIPLGGRWPIGRGADAGADASAYRRRAGLPPEPLMAATERASVRPSSPALHSDERAVQPASPPAISTGV